MQATLVLVSRTLETPAHSRPRQHQCCATYLAVSFLSLLPGWIPVLDSHHCKSLRIYTILICITAALYGTAMDLFLQVCIACRTPSGRASCYACTMLYTESHVPLGVPQIRPVQLAIPKTALCSEDRTLISSQLQCCHPWSHQGRLNSACHLDCTDAPALARSAALLPSLCWPKLGLAGKSQYLRAPNSALSAYLECPIPAELLNVRLHVSLSHRGLTFRTDRCPGWMSPIKGCRTEILIAQNSTCVCCGLTTLASASTVQRGAHAQQHIHVLLRKELQG